MEPRQDDIIEKCRVCEVPVTDGDFVFLFNIIDNVAERTYSGQLFEELIQLECTEDTSYPYICNGCDLQMKLFKRLKEKAWKRVVAKSDTNESLARTLDIDVCNKSEEHIEVESESFSETKNLIFEVIEENSHPASNAALSLEPYVPENAASENQSKDLGENLERNNFLIMNEADSHSLQSFNIDDLIEVDNGDENEEYIAKSEESIGFIAKNEDIAEDSPTVENEEISNCRNKRRDNHAKSIEAECKDCGSKFPSTHSLKLHRQENHGRTHLCSICSKLFKTAENLEGHMRKHLGLPAYECEVCNKTFNQKVHYQYHMKTHTNKRDFACSSCDKSYFSKSDLTMHFKRYHEGEKNFVCSFKDCGKRFFYEQHLRYHSYVHGGQKNFECDVCQQKFKAPNALTMHKKTIHSAENRFICSQCGKTFRRKHHLTAHSALHINQNENQRTSDNNAVINRKINILRKKPRIDSSSKNEIRSDEFEEEMDDNILETINDDSNDNFLMDVIDSCSEMGNQNEPSNYGF